MRGRSGLNLARWRRVARESAHQRLVISSAIVLLLLCVAAVASADDQGDSAGEPISADVVEQAAEGAEDLPPLTDQQAAAALPHADLDRHEAVHLIEEVFGPELQAPAGPFDELNVEKYLADNVAVIADGEQPSQGTGPASEAYDGPTLLSSSVPLRAKSSTGKDEEVDLSLEHSEGELQPSNPLVEIGIPDELGEGLSLVDSGIQVKFAGIEPDVVPSTIEKSVAFYPNVGPDTDLAIAPTPTGVETFSLIRSAQGNTAQTLIFDGLSAQSLRMTQEGGAELLEGSTPILDIAPPVALDAAGLAIPTQLTVDGNAVKLAVTPDDNAKFPILLDPLIQSYNWSEKSGEGISGTTFGEEWTAENFGQAAPLHTNNWGEGKALGVNATLYPGKTGEHAAWRYTVPRYYNEVNYFGTPPTSFITHMMLSHLRWSANSEQLSPYLKAGLWDVAKKEWITLLSHEGLKEHGLNDLNYLYQFNNAVPNTNVKMASVGMWLMENISSYDAADVAVAVATLELSDSDNPAFGSISGPAHWVDQKAEPFNFSVSDTGLGVYALTASSEQVSWKTLYGCVGTSGHACPRTWSQPDGMQPDAKYEPGKLPQGIKSLKVVAEDPLGHLSSPATVQVKVDHTAPGVTLSGSITEQASLGTKWPTYTLRLDATDGTAQLPQSGVAKTVMEVDGKVVDQVSPGCTTQNCTIAREWTLEASKYSTGEHTVKVTVTDAVGLTATKVIHIELKQAPPSMSLAGSMTEQASLGTSRPRYILKVDASADAGLGPQLGGAPTYASKVGSRGSGNGQFMSPGGAVADAAGNVWVADSENNRIEKFNAKGEYVSQFGSKGSGNGQFSRVTAIAIDPAGYLWASDCNNNRIQKFKPSGEFLLKVGTLGTGNGQLKCPEAIAVDSKGNVWVADTYNNRVQEFNEKGEFLRVIGAGQATEAEGIAVGPANNIWVSSANSAKVLEYNEEGELIRQVGSEGPGNGQFKGPTALTVDSTATVWVIDKGNGRVEGFNQSGQYVAQFGAYGTGSGQFNFGWWGGITSDPAGNLWVIDTWNDRMQKWTPNLAPPIPTFAFAFGSHGSGNGQVMSPGGDAVDASGNLWVADSENDRIEKFNSKAEYISAFGSAGTANGKFERPSAVAIDPAGNIWVTDTDNNRIQKFNSKGEYLLKAGASGTGNGQLKHPEAIAVDSKGNVWVADTYNNRVQEFNEKGEFLRVIGAGQATEAEGIAVGPANNIWVSSANSAKVLEYSEGGQLIRQFGSKGSDAGQFETPEALTVDPMGTVWVTDQGNARVEGFNQSGEYVGQFGTYGTASGMFNFGWWNGIASDPAGNLWIVDTWNDRVQKWNAGRPRSELKAEIMVDGAKTASNIARCGEEHCPDSLEWIFKSSSYAPGIHTIVAKVTDGLGNTASKTLSVETQSDTTAPTIEISGELFNAPEGWVEQDEYQATASAKDNGYGATSLELRFDGKTVGNVGNSCSEGGCSLTLSKTLSMSPYQGGAHLALLIATDGAGNTSTKNWTINVDPDGHVSGAEAIDTLEAADETGESTVVAPASDELEPEQMEGGDNPSLVVTGNQIKSEGIPDTTSMSTDPSGGFIIEGPDGKTAITPVVSETASKTEVTAGAAAVSANTSSSVDSIIRPVYNGAQTFQAIRSPDSPEKYSWTVQLAPDQKLVAIDNYSAKVIYEDGSTAFLITAEAAHDVTGSEVPTSINVSGNVLTLKVEFKTDQFTFPIIAGQGWETTYEVPTYIELPEDEYEIKQREEEEKLLAEGSEPSEPVKHPLTPDVGRTLIRERESGITGTVDAPPYPSGGGAGASAIRVFTVKPYDVCGLKCDHWLVYLRNPSFIRGYDWAHWEEGSQVHCGWGQSWLFEPAIHVSQPNPGCGYVGPMKVWKGEGKHLTMWGRYRIAADVATESAEWQEKNFLALQIWVWPNGFQERWAGHWDCTDAFYC